MEKTTAVSTAERKGDWFVTYTGRRFFPLDPRVEDVDIRDIAHALALQTRWMGHCKTFYSIASHSLACARVAEKNNEPAVVVHWALMHDAAEAYVGDIVRPIKQYLCRPACAENFNDAVDPQVGLYLEDPDEKGYARIDGFVQAFGTGIEKRLLRLIAERFGLPWPVPETVKEIDNRMLVTEALHMTNYDGERYVDGETHWIHEPNWKAIKLFGDAHVLLHQTPQQAEEAFLKLAKEYLGL